MISNRTVGKERINGAKVRTNNKHTDNVIDLLYEMKNEKGKITCIFRARGLLFQVFGQCHIIYGIDDAVGVDVGCPADGGIVRQADNDAA